MSNIFNILLNAAFCQKNYLLTNLHPERTPSVVLEDQHVCPLFLHNSILESTGPFTHQNECS